MSNSFSTDASQFAQEELGKARATINGAIAGLMAFIQTANNDVQGELPKLEQDAVTLALSKLPPAVQEAFNTFLSGLVASGEAAVNPSADSTLNHWAQLAIAALQAMSDQFNLAKNG